MKGYLIDPSNKTITEVDYDGNYRSIAKLIKAESGLFDLVRIADDKGRADVFVDDEGLLYNGGNPHGYFHLKHSRGYWQQLAGCGLVLDVDDNDGETIAASCSLEWINERVIFA